MMKVVGTASLAPAAVQVAEFSGNRIGALSDLATEAWRRRFQELEEESNAYISYMQAVKAYSPEYDWPVDPLHNYTRIWEYPYVAQQLRRHAPPQTHARLLDVGSGLSFLPAFLSRQGYTVTSLDYDPIARRTMLPLQERADCPPALGRVAYLTGDCQDMSGLAPASFDTATVVSVLEHLPHTEAAVRELARILRPGGVLVLTLDLALQEKVPSGYDRPLDPTAFQGLLTALAASFAFPEPDRITHPRDILRHSNHPRSLSARSLRGGRMGWRRLLPLRTLPSRLAAVAQRTLQGADVFCVYGLTAVRR